MEDEVYKLSQDGQEVSSLLGMVSEGRLRILTTAPSEYDSAIVYSIGNCVIYNNGFYESLIDNNQGNTPSDLENSYWKLKYNITENVITIVILTQEPQEKYAGFIYLILDNNENS